MENGERKAYPEVFPGLEPDTSLFTLPLAFDEADIDLVVYASLKAVLPSYDANKNRWIEKPELIVLYLREGARGLGQPVKAIGVKEPVGALVLPQTEVGGLTRYLKLRVRTDLRYDSRPPEGIETIDLRLENGVVIVIPGS